MVNIPPDGVASTKKRVAVLLDGTWNTVNDNTNVWRLKSLLASQGRDGRLCRCPSSATRRRRTRRSRPARPRNIARGLQMLAEAREQPVDQAGLRQRLAKQPDRGGIRHRVLEFQIEKAHERQPVTDQVLGLLVREIVQRL